MSECGSYSSVSCNLLHVVSVWCLLTERKNVGHRYRTTDRYTQVPERVSKHPDLDIIDVISPARFLYRWVWDSMLAHASSDQ